MNQREFTQAICKFLVRMASEKRQPIGTDWQRSPEAQFANFKKGRALLNGKWIAINPTEVVTDIDGYNIIGPHQRGVALDIYLVVTNDAGAVKILWEWPVDEAIYWHGVWEKEFGGKPMTILKSGRKDFPHFEG